MLSFGRLEYISLLIDITIFRRHSQIRIALYFGRYHRLGLLNQIKTETLKLRQSDPKNSFIR